MLGTSRVSSATVQEYLVGLFDNHKVRRDFFTAGSGCLRLSDLLDQDSALRSALADSSRSATAKADLCQRLLATKLPALAVEVLGEVTGLRWGSSTDLIEAVEAAGATLILMSAEANGRIDAVEEELFRFGRAIDANPPLQLALTDPATSGLAKSGIVKSLLDRKAAPETIELLAHTTAHLRGRRIQAAVETWSALAAARHGRVVAEARSAIVLTSDQRHRLAGALAKLHGRAIDLNVTVDPGLIGGIEVRVNDEVIDGTIISKLEQARRRLTG